MKIQSTTPTSFQYNHPLKTLWKKGKLPTVTRGLYGGVLTRKNLSLEHIHPVSAGGKTILSNLALATKKNNNARGSENICKFLTFGMIREYLAQFKDIKVKGFDGNEYIRLVKTTLGGLIND